MSRTKCAFGKIESDFRTQAYATPNRFQLKRTVCSTLIDTNSTNHAFLRDLNVLCTIKKFNCFSIRFHLLMKLVPVCLFVCSLALSYPDNGAARPLRSNIPLSFCRSYSLDGHCIPSTFSICSMHDRLYGVFILITTTTPGANQHY